MHSPESSARAFSPAGASRLSTLVFAALLVLCLGFFVATWLPQKSTGTPDDVRKPAIGSSARDDPKAVPPPGPSTPIPEITTPGPTQPPQAVPLTAKPLQRPARAPSPEPAQVVEIVANAMLNKDIDGIRAALGPKLIHATTTSGLSHLFGTNGYAVDAENAVSQLGSQPDLQLWAVHLRHRDHPDDRALVELAFTRDTAGRWWPTQIILPGQGEEGTPGPTADSAAESSATTFARAILAADFQAALECGARNRLAAAAVVGLAVLASEGDFHLREANPLTTTRANASSAWFLVQVVSRKWQIESRFGLVLQLSATGTWQVTALNLDSLLAVSAIRLGGGDPAFTPLIRTPGEGDALAVYFAKNSAAPDARGQQVIAHAARFAAGEVNLAVRVDGHGDAGEKEGVERVLSKSRAEAVAGAMVAAGVDRARITTDAHAASKPRRANFRPDGSEDPAGRQLNRRVEIHFNQE